VDLFGGLGASLCQQCPGSQDEASLPSCEVQSDGLCVNLCVGPRGGREVEDDGCGLEHELRPELALPFVETCSRRTDWKVFFPSSKSKVPYINLLSPFLSPLDQLLAKTSHSGWNSWHSWHPNRAPSAVSKTTTE
jgi:hypothetical protein